MAGRTSPLSPLNGIWSSGATWEDILEYFHHESWELDNQNKDPYNFIILYSLYNPMYMYIYICSQLRMRKTGLVRWDLFGGTLMEIHFSTMGVSTVSFPQQFRAGVVMFRSDLDWIIQNSGNNMFHSTWSNIIIHHILMLAGLHISIYIQIHISGLDGARSFQHGLHRFGPEHIQPLDT